MGPEKKEKERKMENLGIKTGERMRNGVKKKRM